MGFVFIIVFFVSRVWMKSALVPESVLDNRQKVQTAGPGALLALLLPFFYLFCEVVK